MKAKDNPFRVDRLHELEYQFSDSEQAWQKLLLRLQSNDFRGAIQGPHGVGKTTLMLEIQQRVQQLGWETNHFRLTDQDVGRQRELLERWLERAAHSQILLLDSAGLLNFWQWTWFHRRSRSYRGLIITSHRSGRLPTLVECQSSPELLHSLVTQLVQGHDCSREMDAEQVRRLHRTHRGNIRDCLRALYDEFAEI